MFLFLRMPRAAPPTMLLGFLLQHHTTMYDLHSLFMGLMYWYVNCVLYDTELGQGTLLRGRGTRRNEVSHTPPLFVSPVPPPSFLTAKHPVLLSCGKEREEGPGL